MQRSTKIVATLGPASSERDVLKRMIAAGVDVVRMNFSARTALRSHQTRGYCERYRASHSPWGGSTCKARRYASPVRAAVSDWKRAPRSCSTPTPGLETRAGRPGLQELPAHVRTGDVLLLDGSRIVLDVRRCRGQIRTVVRHGGELSNNKDQSPGRWADRPALTAKDMEDIKTATQLKADFLRLLPQECRGHVWPPADARDRRPGAAHRRIQCARRAITRWRRYPCFRWHHGGARRPRGGGGRCGGPRDASSPAGARAQSA